jgi:hypothetical protein
MVGGLDGLLGWQPHVDSAYELNELIKLADAL